MAITLEELKRQNAEKEAAEQVAQPDEVVEEEVQDEETEVEEIDSADDDESTEESESQEVPAWMKSEEQTSQDGDQVPVKTHVAMKHKLKARAKEAENELEELRRQVEQLRSTPASGVQPPPVTAPISRPKLVDFDYDDDKYNEALDDWIESKMTEKLSSFQTKNRETEQQTQQQQRLESSVNQHYERAAKLVEDGLLTAEEYHDSDSMVRRRLDTVTSGNGDTVTDTLLSVLGEGSEKVIVALSRNPSYMMELERELNDDKTGSKALVYLGSLKNQFNSTNNRVSRTPRPAKKIKGDASTSSSEKGAKKAYLAAHKKGDRQAAFDIKRKAKQDGLNVREW